MQNQPSPLRSDLSVNDFSRLAYKGAGLMLLMHGVRGRGIVGTAMCLGGLAMLFPEKLSQVVNALSPNSGGGHREQGTPDAPSFRDDGVEAQQQPEDEVDAAAMASFPASDPPSSYHSTNASDGPASSATM